MQQHTHRKLVRRLDPSQGDATRPFQGPKLRAKLRELTLDGIQARLEAAAAPKLAAAQAAIEVRCRCC